MRKKKNKKNKLVRIAQQAMKAGHILGLSLIYPNDIEIHMRENNYDKDKIQAATDFLANHLKFNEVELKDMNISETLTAANGDNVLYVTFERMEDIKEIHMRLAECGNEDLSTRNFISPGFYDCYMALNKKCSETRKLRKDIKTQIRFGEKDLEVLLKTREGNEPYKQVDIWTFMDGSELPSFNHTKKWKPRHDHPPRRKICYNSQQDPLAID